MLLAEPWTIERTEQKFRYAHIHWEELLDYVRAGANDDWEHAHEEACVYHLVGAIEGTFQEMSSAFVPGLDPHDVDLSMLKKKATSNAGLAKPLRVYESERKPSDGWLALLYELRNRGTHRRYTGRRVNLSTVARVPNDFVDPRNGRSVPGGTMKVLTDFETKARDLVQRIRLAYC